MIEKARSLQLKAYLKLKSYRHKIKALDICETIRKGKSVLFCLPASAPDAARRLIEHFCRSHADWKTTVVAFGETPSLNSSSEVISISPEELNWYGKPKAVAVQRAARQRYDLAIDLSIPYDFTLLALIWSIDAELRVGFHDPRREPFYSFLFRPHSETAPETAYSELLRYLEALM